MPEIGTLGLMSGDGKRSAGHRPQATAPILDSTNIIDEPTFADAILDRLVHNAYRLALGGPSLRNPEAAAAEPASVDAEPAGSKTATHTKPTKGAKK